LLALRINDGWAGRPEATTRRPPGSSEDFGWAVKRPHSRPCRSIRLKAQPERYGHLFQVSEDEVASQPDASSTER
jgi:hypothetical protein